MNCLETDDNGNEKSFFYLEWDDNNLRRALVVLPEFRLRLQHNGRRMREPTQCTRYASEERL